MEVNTADQGPSSRVIDSERDQIARIVLPSIAYLMITLDALVVTTALPSIHRDLGGTVDTLQWTVNAYSLAFGATILTASAIGDRLGRRRVFVWGLALFTLASAICALAGSADLLVAFRAVQGVGAGIVMPLGLTLLTSAFPVERRGAVVGIWGGIAGLGVAAGPLVGGAVTQGISWHWIFWVNVPIGIVAVLASNARLAESTGPTAALDIPALALATSGIGVLIWGTVRASQVGWGSAETIGTLFGGTLLMGGFLAWERRAREPMIPLKLFRTTTFSAAITTQFFVAASIYPAAFLTAQFFQFALGDSPLGTGLRFLPWTATPLLVAPAAGALSDKVGARRLIVPGMLMQAVGFAWIVQLAKDHSGYASYVPPFVIAGVGISMAIACVAAAGLNALPPALLGKASGLMNTMQQFGAVVGIAVATVVFDAGGSLASPASVTNGIDLHCWSQRPSLYSVRAQLWRCTAPDTSRPPSREIPRNLGRTSQC